MSWFSKKADYTLQISCLYSVQLLEVLGGYLKRGCPFFVRAVLTVLLVLTVLTLQTKKDRF